MSPRGGTSQRTVSLPDSRAKRASDRCRHGGLVPAIQRYRSLVVRRGCRQTFALAIGGAPELRLHPRAGAGTTAGEGPGAGWSFRPADRHQHAQVGAAQFEIADDTLRVFGDLPAVLSIVDELGEGRLKLSRHGILRAVAIFMSGLFLPFAGS